MTVLVGVYCQDGVVVGTDSAVTSAAGHQRTVQTPESIKIDFHFGEIISATTGPLGLAQRFRLELETMLQGKELEKYHSKSAVLYATELAQKTIKNFQSTISPLQQNPGHGWGLGALVGFVCSGKAHLAEFDHLQFHPEVKGVTTSDGKQKAPPYVTMGSGQILADPFIAHANRMLFGGAVPKVQEARLLVAWTLKHVIDFNTGGVGGAMQMAALEKINNKWTAHTVDVNEVAQQVLDIEAYIGKYWASGDKSVDLAAQIGVGEAATAAPTVVGPNPQAA